MITRNTIFPLARANRLLSSFFFVLALTYPNLASALSMHNPTRDTEETLDLYLTALLSFKDKCGRYPTTHEGLRALIEKPPKLECADYPKIFSLTDRPRENRFSKSEDGWGEPLKYRSNGKSFRIDASKGYYLTAVSKMQRSGTHWNNSTSEKNN